MKMVSMEFPSHGIRLTGSERSVNKKSRILESITNSYVAYSRMNRAHDDIYHLLNKTAAQCDTGDMIQMQLSIDTLKKEVAKLEEAYSALYEANSEEELPDECFDNNPDEVL